jgi:hypothetical protein
MKQIISIKCVGPDRAMINGRYAEEGETYEVSRALFDQLEANYPGRFVIVGSDAVELTPDPGQPQPATFNDGAQDVSEGQPKEVGDAGDQPKPADESATDTTTTSPEGNADGDQSKPADGEAHAGRARARRNA